MTFIFTILWSKLLNIIQHTYIMVHKKVHAAYFFNKASIFFYAEDTRILLFLT